MYSNPCGSGIWDLALIPHKIPDYYIIFFISLKIGPTVANQYSSWTNRVLQGIATEK